VSVEIKQSNGRYGVPEVFPEAIFNFQFENIRNRKEG